ncbi:hypothetical protein IJT17_04375 [bacterium]|nr:hypothetical protein [bacterium]
MDDKDKDSQGQDGLDGLLNAGIAGASYETVQRFGSAAKQHYVAYSGEDRELGTQLKKGLKSISLHKVNPEERYKNIHQQAGFSAEVKDVARTNAEKIIAGDTSRKVRTDDIGRVNDPLYDTVTVDANGDVIKGSGTQVKFIGASENDPSGAGNASRALDSLQSKKFAKYLDADAKIEVPSDQYDKILQEADSRIEDLQKQLENRKNAGDTEEVKKLQERIAKLKKIKTNLRKSSVSQEEAVYAREHPELSTAKDIAKLSHRAGLETAKSAAVIGGSVSIVKNCVALVKGDIEPEDAIVNVAKETGTAAAIGYGTGYAGAALKGAMQNAKSAYVRTLAKTNLPATVVAVAVSATKILTRFFKGEIDGVQCLEDLGQEGAGMLSSAMFSVIGQALIPIPVVGGLVGGMVGYAFSSACYGVLTESLKNAKLAREERERVEKACSEHIAMIRQYRENMEAIISQYLVGSMDVFREAFFGIKNALAIGDVDWFIDSANGITEQFGGTVPFTDMNDFDCKMLSQTAFKL